MTTSQRNDIEKDKLLMKQFFTNHKMNSLTISILEASTFIYASVSINFLF